MIVRRTRPRTREDLHSERPCRRPPRRTRSRWYLPGTVVGALLVLVASPSRADLDVAFVLDTTGSMSGEIREVQERVQQLALAAVEVRQGERVRFGIVAFRDRGDAYVTRVSPLSENIAVSKHFLDSLAAAGGGDGPESVVAAVDVALRELDWTTSLSAERQLFLIGDAPPHLDYAGEPDLNALAERARAQRIVIHAIGCRSLPSSGVRWFRSLAYAAEGSYQHIGRVRGPSVSSLDDAVRRAVVSGPEPTERPVRAVWTGRHEVEIGGLLVRQGRTRPAAQGAAQIEPAACTLEVQLPAEVALESDPVVLAVGDRLRVELDLRQDPGAASGIEVWELETCPPLTRPVDVRLAGGVR